MEKPKKINLLIVSLYRDLAEAFIEALPPEQRKETEIGNHQVHFDILAIDPGQDLGFESRFAKVDSIALVVRFLDVLSLEKIRSIYRFLPREGNVSVAVFLLREKGEIDFKISCPACGQKLWLRDTDVSKRGRCPNCKKPFVIMSQADHLRSQLMLPDNIAIIKVARNDLESLRGGILKLLESPAMGIKPPLAGVSAEALKQATMRIQIQDG